MSDHTTSANGPDPRDPLSALAGRDDPATPRAAFAERLRRQLEAELEDLMTDASMETPTTAPTDDETPRSVAGLTLDAELVNPGSLFYFTMPGPDVERSGRFYGELFGWDLQQGDSGYHVANVYPPMGLASNHSTDVEVWIEVTDIEAAVATVRELGGTAEEPVRYDSGWSAVCVDPQGVRFNITVPRHDYRQPARTSTEAGELFYWTLPAPDADASRAFFGRLFGWEFGEPGTEGGMHVSNRLPDGGLGGGREGSDPELFFRVDDLDAAMAKVVELGGTAAFAGEGDEGRHAMCTDDQGVPFGLSQPATGY